MKIGRILCGAVTLALCIVSLVLVGGCGKRAPNKLVVATQADFPPFEYYRDGRLAGIDPELAAIIAKDLGMELVMDDLSFEYLLPTLKQGRADIAISAITITPERREMVDFSEPYYCSGQVAVVPYASPIKSSEDLKGKIIGVQRGTSGEAFVEKKFQKPSRFQNISTALNSLLVGQLDALVVDCGVARRIVFQNKNLRMLTPVLTHEDYGIAVRKGQLDLLKKINSTIRRLKQNGEIQRLIDKHASVQDFQPVVSGGTRPDLKVVVDMNFPPFFCMKGDRPSGTDAVILANIADELNMNVVFVAANSDSVINAVASDNTILLGASGITVTPERQKIVDFSVPYYSSRQRLYLGKGVSVRTDGELKKLRIGTVYKTTGDEYVQKNFPGTRESFSDAVLLVDALRKGAVDGIVIDEPSGIVMTRNIEGVTCYPKVLFTEELAYAVHKGNPELLAKINKILSRMIDEGEIRRICRRAIEGSY